MRFAPDPDVFGDLVVLAPNVVIAASLFVFKMKNG